MSEIGLFLLLVSAALAVAEAHVPTHGALGAAATAAGRGVTPASLRGPPRKLCWLSQ